MSESLRHVPAAAWHRQQLCLQVRKHNLRLCSADLGASQHNAYTDPDPLKYLRATSCLQFLRDSGPSMQSSSILSMLGGFGAGLAVPVGHDEA